jgi:glutamyl-tRNA synthetase
MSTHQAPLTGGVRFAPSPTGRFHIGNLRTAWISYRWAEALRTRWIVRVEDIDRPRVLDGAQKQQLQDMAQLGLKPDIVLVQSDFRRRHWQLFLDAIREGQVYPCDCSRKDVQAALAAIASAPHDAPAIYSGRCTSLSTHRPFNAMESLAWRFRMHENEGHDDMIIARSGVALDSEGLPEPATFVPAYHWACAIDDFDGGYDLLVRSIDLLPAAATQRAIQAWLSTRTGLTEARLPAVFHTSLVTQDDGHRLEKRTCGVTLPELAQKGIVPTDLVAVFAKSFDERLLLSPVKNGEFLRETQDALKLSDLGLSID